MLLTHVGSPNEGSCDIVELELTALDCCEVGDGFLHIRLAQSCHEMQKQWEENILLGKC